ncbi:MAG: TetM/TetW/TetO/TetS family tetracycline resistance ribosomal protection protein [Clostridia bacterium]|nr:TetM/TetW/TetO/TetS family tetracycline resistance ribosomal protection protein [Clostridia bacterium]
MNLTLGVAAHVDAGKTTLCEQLLAHAGVLRRCGRVDHGDAFMDGHALERARGITIFCEQATIELARSDGETIRVTLMDTPGHVDFSGEMERALSVLDGALLVVSCAEGVQSHTVTLFRLLKDRGIPTIIFLNKTDREGADVYRVMEQMQRLLSPDCALMTQETEALREELAMRDEELMELHLMEEAGAQDYLLGAQRAMKAGQLYPVLPGSALADQGIDQLEEAIASLFATDYDQKLKEPFCAKVYRVRRIDGMRYCYIKALSGSLTAREDVATKDGAQKVNAICSAQGGKLTPVSAVCAGQTAVVTGLSCRPGEQIGAEPGVKQQQIVPLMSVDVTPKGALDRTKLLLHLRELEEEDPLLSVRAENGRLSVGIMGAVQIEVLGSILRDRFADEVEFLPPKVIYKETIAAPAVGVGHYEPLRHYAEAWLRLVPGEPGSGVRFRDACAPNTLDLNWRRLIAGHVSERVHPGVLTGSALTDVCVELIAGRAHLKHTEGGDFREATYRAIRNALMHAQNVLLEPVVRFELAFHQECLSRVTGELLRLGAELDAPEYRDDEIIMGGTCTAAAFWDYPQKFAASTRGHGRLASGFDRYAPCKNQEAIVKENGYSPLADEKNPPGSVFCSHGAGFYVSWDHVGEWAHCGEEAELALGRLK